MTRVQLHHECTLKDGLPTCGGVFKCVRCKRQVGWCLGCSVEPEDDSRNEMCVACQVATSCFDLNCDGKLYRAHRGKRCSECGELQPAPSLFPA